MFVSTCPSRKRSLCEVSPKYTLVDLDQYTKLCLFNWALMYQTLPSKHGAESIVKQDCIPVGCIPPACRPYLPRISQHALWRGGYLVLGGTFRGYLVLGVYLLGGVPGPKGGVPAGGVPGFGGGIPARGCLVPGGGTCQGYLVLGGAYLRGGYLVPGAVPARGYLVPGVVPGPRGCTCWGCTWSRGVYLMGGT